MATLLTTDGKCDYVKDPADLAGVRALIDSQTAVPIWMPRAVLFVDEDGGPRNLPLNVNASTLVGSALVGPVLMVSLRCGRTILGVSR